MLAPIFLCGCDVNELSSLREVSRPYAGEYKCTRLQLGGENLLDRYEYLKLNLGYGGNYRLFYRATDGNEGGFEGKYLMKEDQITFFSEEGGEEKSFVFPYRKGAVEMLLTFREKPLLAEFATT